MTDAIRQAWYAFCRDNSTREGLTVIYAEELSPGLSQGPRPKKPYLTIRVVGPRVVTFQDDLKWDQANGKFEISGKREYTVSIQSFGLDAIGMLSELQTRLQDPSVTLHFRDCDANIGIIDRGDVLNITELVDTGFEERANLDVRFHSSITLPTQIGSIETVEYSGEIDSGIQEVEISDTVEIE